MRAHFFQVIRISFWVHAFILWRTRSFLGARNRFSGARNRFSYARICFPVRAFVFLVRAIIFRMLDRFSGARMQDRHFNVSHFFHTIHKIERSVTGGNILQ